MPSRKAKSLRSLALALLLSLLAVELSGQPPSESYTPPLTAWGHPDLQGVWNNNTNVPLERPDEFEGRTALTDEEVAERGRTLSETVYGTPENRVDVGGTGFYSEYWNEPGPDLNRSSLLIEPADGKLPALTAEGERDRAAGGPYVQRAPTDISDLSVYERCITRGLPGGMMPGFYNHNYQIAQTPEYVAILVEMIHDARIIQNNCQGCHRPSGTNLFGLLAPMPLTSYEDTRPWARSIAMKVRSREMPPWFADEPKGVFKNERGLTDVEISTIDRRDPMNRYALGRGGRPRR